MPELVFAEPGGRPLRLDLHLPGSSLAGPVPVIVFVHGGGWNSGTRHEFGPEVDRAFERMVDAGLAVASVEYRLSDEAIFPAQVDDVVAALRWIAASGSEFGLDAARVVLWGESAGAALAALAAFRADAPVLGVVDWYGPTDLAALGADLDRLDDPDCAEGRLLGGTIASRPEAAVEASAALQVAGAVAAGRPLPAFLIAHGTADASVPASQATALADALRQAGGEVELDLVEGAGHRWETEPGRTPPVDRDGIFERALRFALERLYVR
ncbi:acetyl esterase/lipase [Agromyces terreus]|uniref:Acetyl esterase/lipase n=1 Tax=Agromyces terreus TaxID=424795 RepID=A0A9X2KAE6_9MICO|nr:alpha/beta hydrolase [Agromyces terreus]MCP2370283.1 acetyl esterase/lipase [Agromyces terreus]